MKDPKKYLMVQYKDKWIPIEDAIADINKEIPLGKQFQIALSGVTIERLGQEVVG